MLTNSLSSALVETSFFGGISVMVNLLDWVEFKNLRILRVNNSKLHEYALF